MSIPIWFVLGRESLLSYAEIRALFPDATYQYQAPLLKMTGVELPPHLIMRLGGTIKIARELNTSFTHAHLETVLLEHLNAQTGKIIFGVSWYTSGIAVQKTPSELETLGKKLKKILQENNRSVRYIPNREPILSSVTVDKNNLITRGAEYLVHDDGSGRLALAQTIAVQPFEAFSERDFGRPGRDDKSGMLPPKLALMMINLSQTKPGDVLLDPFCGSGTILTEAQLLGFTNLIGSDLSEKAIHDTAKNEAWLSQKKSTHSTQPARLIVSDVRKLKDHLVPGSIDTIVTEPYLGKPLSGRESDQTLSEHITQLAPLYRETLSMCAQLLKSHGSLVMIVPRYRGRSKWFTIPFATYVTELGLKIDPLLPDHQTLVYARANQHVGREIWRLIQ